MSCECAYRAILNNRTLLKRKGMTLAAQIREFNDKGLYLCRSTMYSYRRFRPESYKDVGVVFLVMLADYWKKPVWEFISVDYSLEDRKPIDDLGASRIEIEEENKELGQFI